jgi:hypothetical protein
MASPSDPQNSDYHRGDMDIHEQATTFHAFIGLTKWGSLALTACLSAMVIWFCTPMGFISGLVALVAITAGGIVLLRDKPGAH